MKITSDDYKRYIKDEYIRSYTQYQAMILLAKQQGVDTDDVPTPTPDPTPDPQPEPEPTPTPIPEPEPSTEPTFVYNGSPSYTIDRGEHAKFTIYLNNCKANEWQSTCPGEPDTIRVEDKWSKTSNGYMVSVDVKGVNYGYGEYCLYWRKDEKNKDKWLRIKINVKG